jgi:hypothetical protein
MLLPNDPRADFIECLSLCFEFYIKDGIIMIGDVFKQV